MDLIKFMLSLLLTLILFMFSFLKVEARRFGFAYVRYSNVRRAPNPNIINTTLAATSLTKCAIECGGLRSYSLYFIISTQTCHCNDYLDHQQDNSANDEIIYGQIDPIHQDLDIAETFSRNHKQDCLEWFDNGHTTDGVYPILPTSGRLVDVWCDMTNGGWTVFQRRMDGSEDFYRTWDEYREGFGNRTGEYWLGLDNINLLTNANTDVYIDFETFGDVTPTVAYAQYSTFVVGSLADEYPLTIGGYTGTCTDDGMRHVNSGVTKFTTRDNDNEIENAFNCAQRYTAGYWYTKCAASNLNGMYLGGSHTTYADGIEWNGCYGFHYSLKTTVMKVRRKQP